MEILFPAGSLDYVYSAIKVGANAVYGGLKLWNARNKAVNFDTSSIKKAIQLCHENGLKFYLTLNTLMFDDEIDNVIKILKDENIIPDSFIVADLGLILELKKNFPDIPIHISTQFGVSNLQDALFAKNIGAERVILSRELTKSEIDVIKNNVDIEIEIFVWGSQCISFSGSCFLGSVINGGTANRGKCITLCRDVYYVNDSLQNCLYVPDLNCIKVVDDSFDSLKIEGRRRKTAELENVVNMIKDKSLCSDCNGFFLSEFPTENKLYESVNSRQKKVFSFDDSLKPLKEDVWVENVNGKWVYVDVPSGNSLYVYSEFKSDFQAEKFNISLDLTTNNGFVNSILFLNHKGEAKTFVCQNENLIEFAIDDFKNSLSCEDLNLYSVKFKRESYGQKILISKSSYQELVNYINSLYKDKKVIINDNSKALDKVYVETDNFSMAKQLLDNNISVVLNLADINTAYSVDFDSLKGDIIFKLPFFDFKNKGIKELLEKLVNKSIMLTKFSQLDVVSTLNFKKIYCDYLIPVWNKRTLNFLKSKGVNRFCASFELSTSKNLELFKDEDETMFLVGGSPTCVYTRQCFKNAYLCENCNNSTKYLKNHDRNLELSVKCYSSFRVLYYKRKILNAYDFNNSNFSFLYIARDESLDELIDIVCTLKTDDYFNKLKKFDLFKNFYSNLLEEDVRVEN